MFKIILFGSIAFVTMVICGYINQKIINAPTLKEATGILYHPLLMVCYGVLTPGLIMLSERQVLKGINNNYWVFFLITGFLYQIASMFNGYIVSKQKPTKQMLVCLILNLVVVIVASIPLPDKWTK